MKLDEGEIFDSTSPKVKTLQMDSKKYVILKNHVKELNISTEEFPSVSESSESLILSRKQARKLKKLKQKDSGVADKSNNLNIVAENKQSITQQAVSNPSHADTINPSDIEELRSVYKKCKEILMKIETKYGHLLELDSSEYVTVPKKPRLDNSHEKCHCIVKKKILFDDDGKQLETETDKSVHICPNKLKRNNSDVASVKKCVQIEYGEEKPLPHDLIELSAILRDESIELTFRNEVINKIKAIRQAHMNELKFEKPALIEKLKQSPEDVFEFKGSNLFSLPGYPK